MTEEQPRFQYFEFPAKIDQQTVKGETVTIKLVANLKRVDVNKLAAMATTGNVKCIFESNQTELIKDDKDNPDQIDMFDTDAEMTDEEKVQRAKEAITDEND